MTFAGSSPGIGGPLYINLPLNESPQAARPGQDQPVPLVAWKFLSSRPSSVNASSLLKKYFCHKIVVVLNENTGKLQLILTAQFTASNAVS